MERSQGEQIHILMRKNGLAIITHSSLWLPNPTGRASKQARPLPYSGQARHIAVPSWVFSPKPGEVLRPSARSPLATVSRTKVQGISHSVLDWIT
jgi:hypothetical protein